MSPNKLPSHFYDFTSAAKKLNTGRKCSKEPKITQFRLKIPPDTLSLIKLDFSRFRRAPILSLM